MPATQTATKTILHYVSIFFWLALGAFLAAIAIRIFLLPNQLIDGGVVGIALIISRLYGDNYLSYVMILLNIPFIYLAYNYIRRSFVLHMLVAVVLFAGFLMILHTVPAFIGDPLEIIVFGGAILGI